jgi:hypothetical protein
MARHLDCAPKLRQSEFGHSSANGEEDVRRTETKMGPLAGRIPATGVRADEELPPNVKVLAKELGVARRLLYLWKQQGGERRRANLA